MSKRFALAALPVLIGVAIDASGLGGPTVTLIAWLLVAITLFFLFAHWLWNRRAASSKSPARRWHRLGKELVSFARQRGAEAARAVGAQSEHSLVTFVKRGRRAEWKRQHDDFTMDIYLERFAERVREAICELREIGLLGEMEAESLRSPTRPEEVERLGRRLMDLSYQAP